MTVVVQDFGIGKKSMTTESVEGLEFRVPVRSKEFGNGTDADSVSHLFCPTQRGNNMSIHRRQMLFVAILFLLPSWMADTRGHPLGDDEDHIKISKDRIRTVRKMYSHLPSDILGLKEPVKLKDAGIVFDGGTLYITLEDTDGKVLNACIGIKGSKERRYRYVYSHVYLGAIHWSKPSARKVAIRGPEESALYALLIRVNKTIKKADREKDPPGWIAFFPDVLSALDLRYCYQSEAWSVKKREKTKAPESPKAIKDQNRKAGQKEGIDDDNTSTPIQCYRAADSAKELQVARRDIVKDLLSRHGKPGDTAAHLDPNRGYKFAQRADRMLREWNPIFFHADQLRALLGDPQKTRESVLVYSFTVGPVQQHWEFRMDARRVIVGVAYIPH